MSDTLAESTHTATPWYTKPTAGDHDQHLIIDETTGKNVALVYTSARDSAFIIRAANNHNALAEALRLAQTWLVGITDSNDMHDEDRATLAKIDDALRALHT